MKKFSILIIAAVTLLNCTSQKVENEKPVDNGIMPLGIIGTVIQHDSILSKYIETRPVSVWLPKSYSIDSNKSYPVMYFMDGQNLFDPNTSYIGVDWALDEWADSLMSSGKMKEAIIVGVWNTENRTSEYYPQKARDYDTGIVLPILNDLFLDDHPRADNFLKYVVFDVKSFIDSTYRTQNDRNHTIIGGSSMGGLISLYGLSEYPDVFGTALCISTHWPINNGNTLNYFKDKVPVAGNHRIYFDYGTETLDAKYEPYQIKMDEIMKEKGYSNGKDWITLKFEGHEHSERAWRKRADKYLLFALGN